MSTPTALVVDDNVDLAENLREILEDEGWACQVVAGGDAALEVLEHRRFDVVITDFKMEGMTGLDLLRLVVCKWPSTPVILVTAYARERVVKTAHGEGAIDVLPKPIDMATLLDTAWRLVQSQGRVLLVEDDAALRENLSEIFADCPNIELTAVGTCHEAEAAASGSSFDVAVIDLRLPDGNGMELAKTLHARLGTRCPTLVFTSAFLDEMGDVTQTLPGHPPSVLNKPFSPAALLSLVRKAI